MNRVAQLDIKVVLLEHNEKQRKFLRSAPRENPKTKEVKRRKATYAEEIVEIISSKERNLHVMRFAAELKGNTIVMIKNIDHGENLYKWMKEVLPDRDIYLYTGATSKEMRKKIRAVMEEKENAIIIGSLGTISTGISIKRLHNLVFAHPSKSRIKVLQSIGRLLRKSKHGNRVNMYDLVDVYCIGAYVNYTYDHGQKRVQYYTEQQFNFEIISIKLE